MRIPHPGDVEVEVADQIELEPGHQVVSVGSGLLVDDEETVVNELYLSQPALARWLSTATSPKARLKNKGEET